MAKVQQITDIPNEILDWFAEDRLAVEAFKPTQNSYDRGWARVKLALQVNPANKPVTLKGKKYTVEIAACEMQRKVRAVASVFEKLKKLFGTARFWGMVTFPVTPLDALCDEEQKKDSIETTPTGARKIVSASLVDGAANAA